MATTLISSLTEKDKSDAVKRLIDESTPRDDFFMMTVLSILMATLGLMLDSVAIIIGSMLIAPLLSPILSLSLGVVMADTRLILRSFFTILKAILYSVPAAAILALVFASQTGLTSEFNAEILTRTQPSIIYAVVALIAGIAASFALIKPQLSATLPGIAISVAIIPPLAVTGIGLSQLNGAMIADSLIMFTVNAISIMFASLIVFSMMRLYVKRPIAEEAISKEDNQLEKEKRKAGANKKKEKAENKKLKEIERIDKQIEDEI
jgi:uncharacterized hydrophobic protein (TIGR00271 family)